jgi:hypothetical protein
MIFPSLNFKALFDKELYMKIIVEFKDAEEREKILSMVTFALKSPSTDLDVIENLVGVQLQAVMKEMYVQGCLVKVQLDKKDEVLAQANSLL